MGNNKTDMKEVNVRQNVEKWMIFQYSVSDETAPR